VRNSLTILRRELKSYFTGPIGAVYLVAFILFTNLLALFIIGPAFFEMPLADMRKYMHVMIGVSAFLVAAITMRLWSEERKENTFEMLLTFPMKAHELVLGKFLASMAFYGIALACTLTVPLMMITLSRPDDAVAASALGNSFFGLLDPWTTVSGYFGAVLAGAFFISFGLFLSSLCRDQIVAFVLTAPALFFAYILGLNWIKDAMDSALASFGKEVGTKLGEFIGIFFHFDNLVRGLVMGSDIVFFLIWIAIFLVLNGLAIERRSRPNGNLMFAIATAIMLVVGLVANWVLADVNLGRLDVTQEKVFSIDEVSINVLKRLKEPVNIRYIVSPRDKLPNEMQNLERDVRDKLDALRLASGNMLRYKIITRGVEQDLKEESAEKEKQDPVEERILKKIKPFPVGTADEGKQTAQLVYSGMEIMYKEKESEVIPQVMMEQLPQLEYFLVKYIDKMTREKAPVVALVAPVNRVNAQMAMMYQQMGRPVPPPEDPYNYLQAYLEQENYQVQRVDLSQESPLPEDYDVLVMVGPKELDERQQWEVNRALVNGKKVFLAVQNYSFDYQMQRDSLSIRKMPENPKVNTFLAASGVTVGDEVLMDSSPARIQMPIRTQLGYMRMPMPAIAIQAELESDSMIDAFGLGKNIPRLSYNWGTTVNVDEKLVKELGLKVTTILRSSDGCWKKSLVSDMLTQPDVEKPGDTTKLKRWPLGVLAEGQFKDAFAGKPAPKWAAEQPNPMNQMQQPPPQEDHPGEIKPAPGKLVLLANARLFHRDFINMPEMTYFLNCVGLLGLDETGRQIRALADKSMQMRAIGDIEKKAGFWKFVQVAGHLIVITLLGILVWVLRRRRREAYAASLS
jgi:ABC-type uncharacterized transport system involved in gliding motility auxiliary subunit/ABC-type transport system involved in cytochrome c biogenesis permease component